jgi:sigma-B regulation protein RsbU (phosphoserine phosphatase)
VRSGAVDELGDTDLLLGVVSRAEYVNRTLTLQPGDALILFTDGVTECENADGIELGSGTVAAAIRTLHSARADTLANAVDEAVLAHVGDADLLGDDVTLVVVSRSA